MFLATQSQIYLIWGACGGLHQPENVLELLWQLLCHWGYVTQCCFHRLFPATRASQNQTLGSPLLQGSSFGYESLQVATQWILWHYHWCHCLIKGWSKVRIGMTLLRAACSLTYIMVEHMHVLSPGSISNMGKNYMDDFPGWLPVSLIICIKPNHAGLGVLILSDISQSMSTLLGDYVWYSTNLSYCIGQRPSSADTKWWMLTQPIKAISSLVTVTRGTDVVLAVPGVTGAMCWFTYIYE